MRFILSTFILTGVIAVSACKKEKTDPKIVEVSKEQKIINTYASKIKETRNWHRYYNFYTYVGNPPDRTDTLSDTTFAVQMANDTLIGGDITLKTITDSSLWYRSQYSRPYSYSLVYYFLENKIYLSIGQHGGGGGSYINYVSY